ncbi:hypothetical protein [Bosea sp. (in: a-proteobacteria)]|uniref:hypothetical protein n=1 Tax=Bosea sp. (in: a-proteobacteria) TaxID=1871050 RepID=UPI00334071CD
MRARVEHGAAAGDPARPVLAIETAEDCERARHRIAALRDSTRGEDEEHELQALLDAVRGWESDHAARKGGERRRTP